MKRKETRFLPNDTKLKSTVVEYRTRIPSISWGAVRGGWEIQLRGFDIFKYLRTSFY